MTHRTEVGDMHHDEQSFIAHNGAPLRELRDRLAGLHFPSPSKAVWPEVGTYWCLLVCEGALFVGHHTQARTLCTISDCRNTGHAHILCVCIDTHTAFIGIVRNPNELLLDND
jgi:hypothetical protein